MNLIRYSTGAKRVLATLMRIEEKKQAAHALMLHCLLLSESRAKDIVSGLGIAYEHVLETFPLENELHQVLRHQLSEVEAVHMDELPYITQEKLGEELWEIVEGANVASLEIGREKELGTEHLLLGMTGISSPVSAWLKEQGVHAMAVKEILGSTNLPSAEPLEVDLDLTPPPVAAKEVIDTYRVIDAAANRAREGLRVVEDYTRFCLEDQYLSRELKNLRHGLADALIYLDEKVLIASRETSRDVGTTISTLSETRRTLLSDVVVANLKRMQEALRSIEEFGKRVDLRISKKTEQLRYETYILEKSILTIISAKNLLKFRKLYLVVGEEQCHHGLGPAIKEGIRGGVEIVQLREKHKSDARLLETAKRVREWTQESGVLFIMNDRPDLAVLAGADGVHVGQDELSVYDARQIVGPEKLVGVSTHSLEQARKAEMEGADYIGVGPVFPSRTKSFDQKEYVGLSLLTEVSAELSIPWFAIGGINIENLPGLVSAGIERVAVSQAICGVYEHKLAAWQLRALLP